MLGDIINRPVFLFNIHKQESEVWEGFKYKSVDLMHYSYTAQIVPLLFLMLRRTSELIQLTSNEFI